MSSRPSSLPPITRASTLRANARVALLFALFGSLGGCLAPPAMLPAKALPLEQALELYPENSEVVELVAPSGDLRRGFFVPSGPDAPVVLHLLDSSGSVAGIGLDLGDVTARLAEMGFASLALDYTGVGLSDGERSVKHLFPDAEVAWAEALRRAGGDPNRVVVRALSIGTIASAHLLEGGARPGRLLWIAPVLPDTVVARFARAFHGYFAFLAAQILFRPVARIDPGEALASADVPCTVLASAEDPLLSDEERGLLRQQVEAGGGEWYEVGGDHLFVAGRARRLDSNEMEALEGLAPPLPDDALEQRLETLPAEILARLPPHSDARSRFERIARVQRGASPEELAAAALAGEDWKQSDRMLWLARCRPFPPLAFEEQIGTLSLAHPKDELSVDVIELLSALPDLLWRLEGARSTHAPSEIGELAAQHGQDTGDPKLRFNFRLKNGVTLKSWFSMKSAWDRMVAKGRTPEEASVYVARTILKAERIPDRLSEDAEGRLRLEALWDGDWVTVPYSPESRTEPDQAR